MSPSEFVLRRSVPADRDWALPLILGLVEQERGRSKHLNLQEPDFYARFFDGEGLVTGALDGERLIAFSLLGFSPFLGELWPPYVERLGLETTTCCVAVHLLVDSDYRGRGLGGCLARDRNRAAQQLGHRTLFATAHPDNVASLKMLRSVGFVPLDQRRVYEARVMRVLMACTLPSGGGAD